MRQFSVVYTTDNSPPANVVGYCGLILRMVLTGHPSAQLVKINQVRGVKRSLLAMFANLLCGLQQCEHDEVFIVEHDVLYPVDYFDYGPGNRDVTYAPRAWFLLPGGFAHRMSPAMSSLAGNRDFLIEAIKGKLKEQIERGKVRRSEIGPMICRRSSEHWTVDVRHGRNVTGMRNGPCFASAPHWGDAAKLWEKMGIQQEKEAGHGQDRNTQCAD